MGYRAIYQQAAKQLADFLIEEDLGLVYGGANVGLMKILADNMLKSGKEVIGVMPHAIIKNEVAHTGLEHFIEVDSMSERKNKMAELSDAFIALPGGFGTLDELFEILIYNQLRISDKPLGFLNTGGYYDKLLAFIDYAVQEGFVRQEHRRNMIVANNAKELVKKLREYKPLEMDKWLEDIKTESGD